MRIAASKGTYRGRPTREQLDFMKDGSEDFVVRFLDIMPKELNDFEWTISTIYKDGVQKVPAGFKVKLTFELVEMNEHEKKRQAGAIQHLKDTGEPNDLWYL